MSIVDVQDVDLRGKRTLLRCDFEEEIEKSVPTITLLIERGAKVVICSHLGRPKQGPEKKYSLQPVATRLGGLLGKSVKLAPDCKATTRVKAMVSSMKEGDVLVLENARFYKGEEQNDPELSRSISSLAEVYINDDFSSAHLKWSSTVGVAAFLSPKLCGLAFEAKLAPLVKVARNLEDPNAAARPIALVMGGLCVRNRLEHLKNMQRWGRVDIVLVGGALMLAFLQARGLSVGSTMVDEELVAMARDLEERLEENGVRLLLPKDVLCGDAQPADGQVVTTRVCPSSAIDEGVPLDLGPETVDIYKSALGNARTIIWNGAVGLFESSQFSKGTSEIAETLAELTQTKLTATVVCGRSAAAAVSRAGLGSQMLHVSTGGAAGLALLEGNKLPGVSALDRRLCKKQPQKKSALDLNQLGGRTVLVRCDLNVPLDAALQISDETFILESLPTIKLLTQQGARVLVCGHLGHPKEGRAEKSSLKPVAKRLGELLAKDVRLAPDCVPTRDTRGLVLGMEDGDVLVLDNTLFHKGEAANDPGLAESIASLAEVYVNDDFSTAHLKWTSTVGVAAFLSPKVVGLKMRSELELWSARRHRPVALILGGKGEQASRLLKGMVRGEVDVMLLGGLVGLAFLRAKGLSIGSAVVPEKLVDMARDVANVASSSGVRLLLPKDLCCGEALPGVGQKVSTWVCPSSVIDEGVPLDLGPTTVALYRAALGSARTIIWNGAMGLFESSQFSKGTFDIAETLAELTKTKYISAIVCGRSAIAAVRETGAAEWVHCSRSLQPVAQLMGGGLLPGLEVLDEVDSCGMPPEIAMAHMEHRLQEASLAALRAEGRLSEMTKVCTLAENAAKRATAQAVMMVVFIRWSRILATASRSTGATEKRDDRRALLQCKYGEETSRQLESTVDMKVTTKKPIGFYIRSARRLLTGVEEKEAGTKKDPVCVLNISGLGDAINAAVAAATAVETEGLGIIKKVETSFPEMTTTGGTTCRCPCISISVRRN